MDFGQRTGQTDFPYQNKRSDAMASASLILGIVSLLTSGCLSSAMVCGALGIIFALLSKGGSMNASPQGKAGLVLSSAGLILTLAIYAGAFAFLLNYYGGIDGLLDEYQTLYRTGNVEEFYQGIGTF